MSDSVYAFFNIKIKTSLSELAFSGFVSKSSESRLQCFLKTWWEEYSGRRGDRRQVNATVLNLWTFLSSSPNVRLTWTMWSDWFLFGGRGVLWVGFCSGKAKKNVFYNGLFKIMRKQTALHNNEKGCLCWRPCSVSEEDCVSWRQVLN